VLVTLSFKASNYSRWSTYFRAACGKFEVLDHIGGSPARLDDLLWVQQDHTVRTWLFISIADDVLDVSIKDEQCAYELWVRIASHFTANQASRAIYLRNEFHSITQGTSSITDYCARQKATADALRAVDHPVQESDLVLNTLP
jgi:hypothetical protein